MSAQTIFEQLRRAGCTVTGALAIMGNMKEERGLEACWVQGDFMADRSVSRDYANKVDNTLNGITCQQCDGKRCSFCWRDAGRDEGKSNSGLLEED